MLDHITGPSPHMGGGGGLCFHGGEVEGVGGVNMTVVVRVSVRLKFSLLSPM